MKGHLRLIAALLVTACSEGPTEPRAGSLTVSTTTTGGDQDEDGYSLSIGSDRKVALGPQAHVVIPDLSAGTHVLELTGVADNCSLSAGTPSRPVTVEADAIASVEFGVTCDATGIEIMTRSTGVDLPPGGYVLTSGVQSANVATNGNFVVSRLRPGSHTVSLTVGDNCSVVGENRVTVNVANRTITPLAFEIVCIRVDRRIAFARDTAHSGNFLTTSILLASATGSGVIPLVPFAHSYAPAWAADGKRLAFSNVYCDFYYGYADCGGGISILDLEPNSTSVPVNMRFGTDPAWRPDGNAIAFTRVMGNFPEVALLHVASLDGSAAVQLDTNEMDAREPGWSPDGQRIVFTCRSVDFLNQYQYDICVINRDGTGLTKLTNDAASDRAPEWSPDGRTIAFTTTRFSQSDVAVMTPGGTDIRQLAPGFDPAWSPDGTRLVFARNDGLFTMNPDGSGATRITTGKHYAPAWRP